MSMTLVFDAPVHHKLVLNSSDPEAVVYGGDKFSSTKEQFAALVAQGVPVKEVAQELGRLSRHELEELATASGIPSPEKLANKEELIAAIEGGQPDHTNKEDN